MLLYLLCCSLSSVDKNASIYLFFFFYPSIFLLFVFSMSAYHKDRLKEEKKASLEQRRNRLRVMLQEEQNQLEAELREMVPDRSTLASQLVQKSEELRTAREDRRKKVGGILPHKYSPQCCAM